MLVNVCALHDFGDQALVNVCVGMLVNVCVCVFIGVCVYVCMYSPGCRWSGLG